MSCRLPNLFIIGYPKCGTTSLFTYLAAHPDFCGSSKKEPSHFFYHRFDTSKYDMNFYKSYFARCGTERFVFEASVTHVRGGRPHALFLKETFEEPKIIVLLREPTERLYSYYHLCRDNGYIATTMSFEEFLQEGERRRSAGGPLPEGIWRSYATRYDDHLFDWMDVFGDDMFIGFFEQLKVAPGRLCDAICDWLDVARLTAFEVGFEVENRTINPRSTQLHRVARSFNSAMEPVFRRHLPLKRRLRSAYRAANARRGGPGRPTPDQQRRLDAMFAPSNARVAAELRRRRPELDLPDWLGGSATAKAG
jgi:hypothetical protein